MEREIGVTQKIESNHNNESEKSTTIETSESIQREILDKAVQLAISSTTLLKSST